MVLAAHEKYSFDNIIAPSSAMGKNVLPRVAAKLNMGMLSDVLAVESADTFVRPMYAGNAIAKVKSSDKVKIMTVRGTSFDEAAAEGGSAEVEEMDGKRGKGRGEGRGMAVCIISPRRACSSYSPFPQPPPRRSSPSLRTRS